MLSRWLFARLRTAENALRAGQLDDAFHRLIESDDRDQRRHRELAGELARAILARARLAAQAGRFRDALGDLDRIARLGAINDDARALRSRVEAESHLHEHRQQADDQAARAAAARLAEGRLESGRIEIERLEDPRRREALKEQLDARVQRSEQLLDEALGALARGDVLAACRNWEDACTRHGVTPRASEAAREIVPAYRKAVAEWFRAGLLDRVRNAVGLAARLRTHSPELQEAERLAELARRAGQQLGSMELQRLKETLLRLRSAAPQAAWAVDALAVVERILALHGELLSGPLGVLASGFEKDPENRIPPRGDARQTMSVAADALRTDRPLLLLLDGTGSAALLTAERVRIGRAGGSVAVDVGLPADVSSHHADITRSGEDYFLTTYGPTRVNGQPVTRTLLHDGDRIVLGTTGKLVFRRPSVRSESAVLALGDRCRMAHDVSKVVLFHETCLIGPSAAAHLETREGDSRVVLFEREGRLWARLTARDNRPAGVPLPLAAGRPTELGDLRLTVKPYDAHDRRTG